MDHLRGVVRTPHARYRHHARVGIRTGDHGLMRGPEGMVGGVGGCAGGVGVGRDHVVVAHGNHAHVHVVVVLGRVDHVVGWRVFGLGSLIKTYDFPWALERIGPFIFTSRFVYFFFYTTSRCCIINTSVLCF